MTRLSVGKAPSATPRVTQLSLKNRLLIRLTTQPRCFDMLEFSRKTRGGLTTFCLAGLILDESGVSLRYGRRGIAVGLLDASQRASDHWINYEWSLSTGPLKKNPAIIDIAAKARELWSLDYGSRPAEALPFYESDWGRPLDQVTSSNAVAVLRYLNQAVDRLALSTSCR